MADRLTSIYTRGGDAGETGTATGERVAKDAALIQAQGDIDELNCLLGLLATKLEPQYREQLLVLQHVLFDIGGEISLGASTLEEVSVLQLENMIDAYNRDLSTLKEFILPGGNEAGALCHLARAVCRRAERQLVSLSRVYTVNPVTLAYINRLSDYLFVFSRVINDQDEIYWRASGRQQAG